MKQAVLVGLVREWLDAQLLEPLARVLEREKRQRERVRALAELLERRG